MFRASPLFAAKAMPIFAITQALQSLPGWSVDGNTAQTINRVYTFPDFLEAMKYMNAMAPICEKMQHHPNWENVYNRINVRLCTHDAGNKVTEKDVELAKAMNDTYSHMYGKL